MLAIVGRRASEIFSIILVGGALYGAHSYYASAADVDKKYERLDNKVDVGLSELRKAMIADQLVRLRTGKKDAGTDAQIKHYESELQNINAKLRDLERNRK
jgi:hypothetical protein